MKAQEALFAAAFRMLGTLSHLVAALFEARSGRGVQNERWWSERADDLRKQGDEAKATAKHLTAPVTEHVVPFTTTEDRSA